jgi:hypothetical protein
MSVLGVVVVVVEVDRRRLSKTVLFATDRAVTASRVSLAHSTLVLKHIHNALSRITRFRGVSEKGAARQGDRGPGPFHLDPYPGLARIDPEFSISKRCWDVTKEDESLRKHRLDQWIRPYKAHSRPPRRLFGTGNVLK